MSPLLFLFYYRLAAFGGEDEESADEESKPVVRETKMEGIEVDLSAAVKAEIAERNKEMRAAELRATLPLDERQEMFKAMLLERGVRSNSTTFILCNTYVYYFLKIILNSQKQIN